MVYAFLFQKFGATKFFSDKSSNIGHGGRPLMYVFGAGPMSSQGGSTIAIILMMMMDGQRLHVPLMSSLSMNFRMRSASWQLKRRLWVMECCRDMGL